MKRIGWIRQRRCIIPISERCLQVWGLCWYCFWRNQLGKKDSSFMTIPFYLPSQTSCQFRCRLGAGIESSRCCSLLKARWWLNVWTPREELLWRRPLADCRIAAHHTFGWFQCFTVKLPHGGKHIRIFLALCTTTQLKLILPLHCLARVLLKCCSVVGSVFVLCRFGKVMGLFICVVRFESIWFLSKGERKWYCVSIFCPGRAGEHILLKKEREHYLAFSPLSWHNHVP